MDFNVKEWLEEKLPDKNDIPRHEWISFLISANGGIEIHGWGIISFDGIHQRGLDQNDALNLLYLSGFFEGLESAGVDFHNQFRPFFEAYVAKIKQRVEEHKKRMETPT